MRTSHWSFTSILCLSILFLACGDSDTELPSDAGRDAGVSADAGRADAGRADSGRPDAAAADATPADATPADAAPADATPPDAASADAAGADATTPDADPVDAGSPDATIPCLDPDASVEGGCLGAIEMFNTGVTSTRTLAAGGSVDPHYALIQSAEATLPGPDAIVVSQIATGFWLGDNGTSQWIAPSEDQRYPGATPCNASGVYVYRTSFDLTGFESSTARVTGGWAADNAGTNIYLNGNGLGLTAGGYGTLSPFVIDSGFLPGVNTLDFEVNDFGCPNGLRVELVGTASVAR